VARDASRLVDLDETRSLAFHPYFIEEESARNPDQGDAQ
jgi:hypothetical protein